MRSYSLQTEFTFGKYKDSTLEQVLDENPNYINFCLKTLDHFYLPQETVDLIKEKYPAFRIDKKAFDKKEFLYKEEEKMKERRHGPREYNFDSDYSFDTTNYNDDLDMDQQSPEFWNQF